MADVVEIKRLMDALDRPRRWGMTQLADRQHGVVATWQLVVLGITAQMIRCDVEGGLLRRLHHGVYAVGHANVSARGRALAAVLAYGPHAVLSHRSAAWLWDLLRDNRRVYDVTVPGRRHAKRPGIAVHQPRSLHPEDVTVIDGIPVTSLARSLLDVAETESPRLLRRTFDQAERLQILDMRPVNRLLQRSIGRRGLKPLLSLIAEGQRHVHETRSNIEQRFVELLRQHGLPEPSTNVMVAGHCVDAYWPDRNLVAEIDTFTYHHTRTDVESDIQRDLDLKLAEVEVVRVPERLEAGIPVLRRLLG
jgi:hypothetical protein